MSEKSKLAQAVEAEIDRLVTQNEKWFYAVVRKIVRRYVEDEVRGAIQSGAFAERLQAAASRALADAPLDKMAEDIRADLLRSLESRVLSDVHNVIRASNEYHDLMRRSAGAGIARLKQMRISVDYE